VAPQGILLFGTAIALHLLRTRTPGLAVPTRNDASV
jgi:hypothetical protein